MRPRYSLMFIAALAATCLPALAFACAQPEPPAAPDRSAQLTAALPEITQGERKLKLSLEQWMKALAIPGLGIAVIDDHRVVWTQGFGVTTPGPQGAPVDPGTVFQAASIAKAVTALAVMRQVGQGRLTLDGDINEAMESWTLPGSKAQAGEPVTLRQLLAHTGGITPGGFAGYARDVPAPDLLQVLDGAAPATNAPARVVAKPGAEVAYSGLGYSLLQLALQDHLDQPFEAVMQETVLQPIGMRDSSFSLNPPESLQARVARGHLGVGAPVQGGWFVHPELAAAGLWSTPRDLAAFAIAIADAKRGQEGALLPRELATQMLAPHREGTGLGLVVRDEPAHGWFAHSGGNVGYFAHFEMLADTGQGVVIMSNSDAGQALASLIIAGVAQAWDWPLADRRQLTPGRVERLFAQLDRVANQRVKVDVDPAVLARYVGRYELAPGQVFELTLVEGQLQLRLGDQPRFPLFAESTTKFFLEAVDAQISFILDADGRPGSLVLHQGGRDLPAPKIE
jgi:CubicO group peptidase (beta-lactamase class C family)